MPEAWSDAQAYESYVGRWSRQIAPQFLAWVGLPPEASVLDVGCGTGALSESALRAGAKAIHGIDLSVDHVEHARTSLGARPNTRFEVADAMALPFTERSFDAAVSGLVINFVPEPSQAVREMRRVVRPNGRVAAYVWDYSGKMEMMRHFWDAARKVDPTRAATLDEGLRFPVCTKKNLERLFRDADLKTVEAGHIDQPTVFSGFDEFWKPFLGGQGPAPAYCASLDQKTRKALREEVRRRVPKRPDGSIHLVARALTVRGTV